MQIKIHLKLIQFMPSINLSPSVLRKCINKADCDVNSVIQVERAMCMQESMFAYFIIYFHVTFQTYLKSSLFKNSLLIALYSWLHIHTTLLSTQWKGLFVNKCSVPQMRWHITAKTQILFCFCCFLNICFKTSSKTLLLQ